jgi:hypothetical protein
MKLLLLEAIREKLENGTYKESIKTKVDLDA